RSPRTGPVPTCPPATVVDGDRPTTLGWTTVHVASASPVQQGTSPAAREFVRTLDCRGGRIDGRPTRCPHLGDPRHHDPLPGVVPRRGRRGRRVRGAARTRPPDARG